MTTFPSIVHRAKPCDATMTFRPWGISFEKKNARLPDKDKLHGGGCTFVDAAPGDIEVEFQTFFSAQETIDAIKRCEQKARDKGIVIQECQFDNGSSFTSRSLKDCLLEQGQTC